MLPAPALPGRTENVAASAGPRHGVTAVRPTPAPAPSARTARASTATPFTAPRLAELVRIERDVERAVGAPLQRERPLRPAAAVRQDQLEAAAELPRRRRAQLAPRAEQLVVPRERRPDRRQQI